MPKRDTSRAGLQTLSLRQNILEDAVAVTRLASAGQLTELILQDNRLSVVRGRLFLQPFAILMQVV